MDPKHRQICLFLEYYRLWVFYGLWVRVFLLRGLIKKALRARHVRPPRMSTCSFSTITKPTCTKFRWGSPLRFGVPAISVLSPLPAWSQAPLFLRFYWSGVRFLSSALYFLSSRSFFADSSAKTHDARHPSPPPPLVHAAIYFYNSATKHYYLGILFLICLGIQNAKIQF